MRTQQTMAFAAQESCVRKKAGEWFVGVIGALKWQIYTAPL